MILSIHSIAGAALAINSKNIGIAIVLGLTSHYFLDSLPHLEYKITNIAQGNFQLAAKEFLKISLDLLIALLVIFYFIQNQTPNQIIFTLTGAFAAILPDGLVFIDFLIKNKEKNIFTRIIHNHSLIHKKIHSNVKNKIITTTSQCIIILILLAAIFTK